MASFQFKNLLESRKYKKIAEYLKLDRSLILFEVETTGRGISEDKIVEISYVKITPEGKYFKNSFLLNPKIKIPDEAVAVHGITSEAVVGKPTFRAKSQEIWDVFYNCYYGGFGILNFDLPFLRREFVRVGMDFDYKEKDVFDVKAIFHYMEPRSLGFAYRYYCSKDEIDPGDNYGNLNAVTEIMERQLGKYKEIRDWHFISETYAVPDSRYLDHEHKFYWRSGEAYFNFSRYKDTPLSEVLRTNRDFLEWILKADFSKETKNIVRQALSGELQCQEGVVEIKEQSESDDQDKEEQKNTDLSENTIKKEAAKKDIFTQQHLGRRFLRKVKKKKKKGRRRK